MNTKNILLAAAAVIITGLLLNPQAAEAYRGDLNTQGPNCTIERHEEMEKALENKDYQAWKKLMAGKGRATQIVNEKNFAQFVKAHELAEQGKTVEAQKIRQELGLGLKNGSGQGYRRGLNQ